MRLWYSYTSTIIEEACLTKYLLAALVMWPEHTGLRNSTRCIRRSLCEKEESGYETGYQTFSLWEGGVWIWDWATRHSLCEKEESGYEPGLPDAFFVRRRSLDMRLATHTCLENTSWKNIKTKAQKCKGKPTLWQMLSQQLFMLLSMVV